MFELKESRKPKKGLRSRILMIPFCLWLSEGLLGIPSHAPLDKFIWELYVKDSLHLLMLGATWNPTVPWESPINLRDSHKNVFAIWRNLSFPPAWVREIGKGQWFIWVGVGNLCRAIITSYYNKILRILCQVVASTDCHAIIHWLLGITSPSRSTFSVHLFYRELKIGPKAQHSQADKKKHPKNYAP